MVKKTTGLAASVVVILIAGTAQYGGLPLYEGTRNIGYRDPAGIPTKCTGDTNNVVVGHRYSDAECRASLKQQIAAHGAGVLACVPQLAGHDYQSAAAVSFAYNVGVGAFCKSTVAKRFRAGDWHGACRAINQDDKGRPQWVSAGGRVLPGLVKRRAAERALCEKGL